MAQMAWYDTAQFQRLEDAMKKGDWFTAIVLSATQLERHGCMKIKDYLESLKVDSELVDSLLKPLYLRHVAECLLVMKIIDKKERRTVMKINDVRKAFVHRREKEKFERGTKAKKMYEPLVNEAKRILREKLGAERLYLMP